MTKDFSMKFSSTIGKLKEGDWLRWSCKISMALRVERGWGYVDGTTTAPKDALEFSAWNAAHNQIVGVLGTMVEAPLQHELKSINNAKVAWKKLKEDALERDHHKAQMSHVCYPQLHSVRHPHFHHYCRNQRHFGIGLQRRCTYK